MIEIFRPELWVHPIPGKAGLAFELRLVTLIVAVIASAHHEKTTAIAAHAIRRIHRYLPLTTLATPIGRYELLTEANSLADTILISRLIDIAENRRAVGDTLLRFPGLEVVTQRVHITVRANAGITEEIPCTANRLSALEQDEVPVGAIALQAHRGADAREPGTDDNHIECLGIRALNRGDIDGRIHFMALQQDKPRISSRH